MLDSNSLYVKDENGEEVKMTILFTFDAPEGAQYVVFQKAGSEDGEIYASRYNDEGELIPIGSDEEWDMVEEVINTFIEDEKNAED